MTDQLIDRWRFLVLTTVEVFTRESMDAQAGPSLKETHVVELLNQICARRECFSVIDRPRYSFGIKTRAAQNLHEWKTFQT